MTDAKPLTGRRVLAYVLIGFGVIIAANMTLLYNAIDSFPGLEVKNSYVASQGFDARVKAQAALGWKLNAGIEDGVVWLEIDDRDGALVNPPELNARIGRPTNADADQVLSLLWNGSRYIAPATLDQGSWNLYLTGEAENGTAFDFRFGLWVK